MAASDAMIARLRRMTAADESEHPNEVLEAAIERYPLLDAAGLGPDSDDWVARYDLNAAAVEVLTEKIASLALQAAVDPSPNSVTLNGVTLRGVQSIADEGATVTFAGATGGGSVSRQSVSAEALMKLVDLYRRRIAPRLV